MAYNSKKNRRDTTQDGDDYIYPTAKVRENKTRDRRSDRNLIEKGLIDAEFASFDECEEGEIYDDTPMYSPEELDELIKEFTDAEDDDNNGLNLSEDDGYEWGNF